MPKTPIEEPTLDPLKLNSTDSEITLTIIERLTLSGLMPPKGDLAKARMIRNIRNLVEFSEEELEVLQITPQPGGKGGITWSDDAPKEYQVTFKAFQIAYIGELLKEQANAGDLPVSSLDLYDKFVEEDTKDPVQIPD